MASWYYNHGAGMYLIDRTIFSSNAGASPTDLRPLYIRSNQLVGVGTSNPEYLLDIAGDLRVQGNLHADSNLEVGLNIKAKSAEFSEENGAHQLTLKNTGASYRASLNLQHETKSAVLQLDAAGSMIMQNWNGNNIAFYNQGFSPLGLVGNDTIVNAALTVQGVTTFNNNVNALSSTISTYRSIVNEINAVNRLSFPSTNIVSSDNTMYADSGYGRLVIRGFYNTALDTHYIRIEGNTDFTGYVDCKRLTCTSATVYGDLFVSGGKSFRYPHPNRPGYDLVHSCIEGPRNDLLYRGNVQLVHGTAIVDVCKESSPRGMTQGTLKTISRYHDVFLQNKSSFSRVLGHYDEDEETITITCEDVTSSDTISWMLVGERNDEYIKSSSVTDDNGDLFVEIPS
jgi:hypothetical protein